MFSENSLTPCRSEPQIGSREGIQAFLPFYLQTNERSGIQQTLGGFPGMKNIKTSHSRLVSNILDSLVLGTALYKPYIIYWLLLFICRSAASIGASLLTCSPSRNLFIYLPFWTEATGTNRGPEVYDGRIITAGCIKPATDPRICTRVFSWRLPAEPFVFRPSAIETWRENNSSKAFEFIHVGIQCVLLSLERMSLQLAIVIN